MPKTSKNQCWIFAVTIWKSDHDKIATFFKLKCKKYIFQQEKCPTTGTLHHQCYINLKDKLRQCEAEKLFNSSGFPGAHVAPASDRGKDELKSYCMKSNSRVSGPWADHRIYLGQDLPVHLRPWQVSIVDLLKTKPDDRKILWYYDAVGGKGKSTLSKYLYYHHKVVTLTVGKASDLLNLVSKMPGGEMYVFDISRTVPTGSMTELYAAIESVKNGYFINTKYDTSVVCMERPHVVVFSNHLPKMSALSLDRWKILDLSQMSQDNLL